MPDNWSFVIAAYGLTALVLGLYWRRLVRKEKTLSDMTTTRSPRSLARPTSSVEGATGSVGGTATSGGGTTTSVAERSHDPSRTAHPRRKPDTPPSLP
jgi:hypothetical protein